MLLVKSSASSKWPGLWPNMKYTYDFVNFICNIASILFYLFWKKVVFQVPEHSLKFSSGRSWQYQNPFTRTHPAAFGFWRGNFCCVFKLCFRNISNRRLRKWCVRHWKLCRKSPNSTPTISTTLPSQWSASAQSSTVCSMFLKPIETTKWEHFLDMAYKFILFLENHPFGALHSLSYFFKSSPWTRLDCENHWGKGAAVLGRFTALH